MGSKNVKRKENIRCELYVIFSITLINTRKEKWTIKTNKVRWKHLWDDTFRKNQNENSKVKKNNKRLICLLSLETFRLDTKSSRLSSRHSKNQTPLLSYLSFPLLGLSIIVIFLIYLYCKFFQHQFNLIRLFLAYCPKATLIFKHICT